MKISDLKIKTDLLALVAQHSSNAVVILNRDEKIIWVNQAHENLTGWSSQEVIGKAPGDFLNILTTSDDNLDQPIRSGIGNNANSETLLVQRKDGHLIWMQIEKEAVPGRNGCTEYFISIERDVTESISQSKKIKENEQFLREAINALADGFVVYDCNDRLVLCNDQYREIYASSADLMKIGTPFEDIIRGGVARGQYQGTERDAENWIRRRMAAHNSPSGEPVEHQLDNGRWIQVRERKTDNGSIVGIRRDITDLKKTQLAAEKASQSKSKFLAHMSHELRSPLSTILGYAELALNKQEIPDLPKKGRHYLQTILHSGTHLMGLIGDILDLSKIEADQLILEKTAFNVEHLVEELVSMMVLPARENGTRLIFPDTQIIEPWFLGDPTRLKQILMNFLSNAVKFTHYGTINVSAKCEQRSHGKYSIRIEIADSGIGIAADKLDNLFTSFIQADTSTTRKYGGTGLGLAISKKLATLMNGSVGAESTLGKGSVFWFEAVFTKTTPVEDHSRKSSLPKLPPMNILIVEDITVNRLMAKRLLENLGHQVSEASDGKEAIDKVKSQHYDVVFMDIHMPIMDGIDATERIRALETTLMRKVPIVALTADIAASNIERYLAAGMDDYLSKPIDMGRLNQILTRFSSQCSIPKTPQEVSPYIPATPVSETGNSNEISPTFSHANTIEQHRFLEAYAQIPTCLDMFANQVETDLKKATQLLEIGKHFDIGEYVHAIRGSAVVLGFTSLAQNALEIEILSQNSNGDERLLKQRLEALRELLTATVISAEKLIHKTKEGQEYFS